MKRILAVFLTVVMLALCGCTALIPGNGDLSLDADSISTVEITNGLIDGNTFTVQDRDAISKIVRYFNSYALESSTTPSAGWHFQLRMLDGSGEEIYVFTIVGDDQLTYDGLTYSVNVTDLLQYVEKLECDTLTDNQLIDRLLTGTELSGLKITDESGNISLDKLLKLTDSCPTLFELLSRPSAIPSISSYGIDAIKENLSGTNTVLKEQAETLAEILREYFPDLASEIDQILENSEK